MFSSGRVRSTSLVAIVVLMIFNRRKRPRPRSVSAVLKAFFETEASGGVLLVGAAMAALIWANSPVSDTYEGLWNRELTIGGPLGISLSLRHWINDGLMAVFFFVVTLEIKREVTKGELKDARVALLPVGLAVGGMVIPALIYAAVNAGTPGARGWGIPIATDIAFAVGVLALVGSRAPASLRLLLLALAIADDLGAIVVIAAFYSEGIRLAWLGLAGGALLSLIAIRRLGARSVWLYLPFGLAVWFAMSRSGIHPTIAGVVLALTVPASREEEGSLEHLEHSLHPWASFLIVPLFALANSGIDVSLGRLIEASSSKVTIGVVLGLFAGKTLGIVMAAKVMTATRLVHLPEDLRFRHIAGLGAIAGIGFTVSLFIANLALEDALLEQASLGVLAGSVLSALIGGGILFFGGRRPRVDLGPRKAALP